MAIFFCGEKKNCSKTRFWNFAEIPTKWTWGRRLWPPECHQITLKHDFSVGKKKNLISRKKMYFPHKSSTIPLKMVLAKKKYLRLKNPFFVFFVFL